MDEATKKEWEKSKRIDEEKMKALRDLNAEKKSKADLAYLDPKPTKLKGYERGETAIMMSCERFANIAGISTFIGVFVSIIISSMFFSGMIDNMAIGMMSNIIRGIGSALIIIGAISAVVSLLASAYYYYKYRHKASAAIWTSVISLAVLAIYLLISQ